MYAAWNIVYILHICISVQLVYGFDSIDDNVWDI